MSVLPNNHFETSTRPIRRKFRPCEKPHFSSERSLRRVGRRRRCTTTLGPQWRREDNATAATNRVTTTAAAGMTGGTLAKIITVVILAVLLMVSIMLMAFCCMRRKKLKKEKAKAAAESNKRSIDTLSAKPRAHIMPVKKPSLPRRNSNKKRQPVGAQPVATPSEDASPKTLARPPHPASSVPATAQQPPAKAAGQMTTSLISSSLLLSTPKEDTQHEDETKVDSTSKTTTTTAPFGSESLDSSGIFVENQYICYENGAWQQVDIHALNSQFSFHLESGHTYSADF
ncbi:hypothetical protein L596_013595 [Steinernema carpocapsae]|uniref:Uncharacterized protein n=1 Tax=Steinernema carpocapsae TaxID=34508 RepID=A0A4U5P140_STECR|nr:hypothetical protein L596_013595 [Steinernema carpocapsae]